MKIGDSDTAWRTCFPVLMLIVLALYTGTNSMEESILFKTTYQLSHVYNLQPEAEACAAQCSPQSVNNSLQEASVV
jgi:hypothetical protein